MIEQELILKIIAQQIKRETGVDFSDPANGLQILQLRLKTKTTNELIAEIRKEREKNEHKEVPEKRS